MANLACDLSDWSFFLFIALVRVFCDSLFPWGEGTCCWLTTACAGVCRGGVFPRVPLSSSILIPHAACSWWLSHLHSYAFHSFTRPLSVSPLVLCHWCLVYSSDLSAFSLVAACAYSLVRAFVVTSLCIDPCSGSRHPHTPPCVPLFMFVCRCDASLVMFGPFVMCVYERVSLWGVREYTRCPLLLLILICRCYCYYCYCCCFSSPQLSLRVVYVGTAPLNLRVLGPLLLFRCPSFLALAPPR